MAEATNDFDKEQRAQEKRDRAFYEAMLRLMKNTDFTMYLGVLQVQINGRGGQMLAALAGMDAVLGQEFEKGTIKGLLLAAELPSHTIASMADTAADGTATEQEDEL